MRCVPKSLRGWVLRVKPFVIPASSTPSLEKCLTIRNPFSFGRFGLSLIVLLRMNVDGHS